MRHGRDHDERSHKVRRGRSNMTPERDGYEATLASAGRKRGVPPQRLYGSHAARLAPIADLDEEEPVGDGAEVAPTPRAEARERERHRLERRCGRLAAGSGENIRDRREPSVGPAELEEAARAADRKVAGRELPRRGGRG